MIKQLLLATSIMLCILFAGCKTTEPSEPIKTTKGFYSVKPAEPEISLGGGTIDVEFVAMDSWSVTSSEAWCSITSSATGEAGAGKITLSVEKFDSERSAILTISVKGYVDAQLCTFVQRPIQTQGGRSVTYWMADIMSRNYLWNTAFDNIRATLDYNVDYDVFLSNALSRTRGNDEDGYEENGARYFYTNCSRTAASAGVSPLRSSAARQAIESTRGQSMQNNYGFNYLMAVGLTSTTYGFLVGSVYPDSPADKAGVKRGTYITKINGTTITEANLLSRFYELLAFGEYYTASTLNIQTATLVFNDNGSASLVDAGVVVVSPANYDANPILFADTYTVKDTDKVIGYMCYASFDLAHDEELIKLFADFKAEGVNELIVDLRYNPGGYVYSSTVLGTMIAGPEHTGDVYSHMVYNADRTDKGEAGYFYIGKNPSMVEYPLIEQSLSSALSLKRVYVLTTDNTASASELVINGLRGLDIDVYTVGTTSQGKNTGMEVELSTYTNYSNYEFGNYVYEFAPITFYNKNAKGFGDYHSGFTPSMEIDEANNIIYDWNECANNDLLMTAAAYHILNGVWPTLSSSVAQSRAIANMRPANNLRLTLPDLGSKVFATTANE